MGQMSLTWFELPRMGSSIIYLVGFAAGWLLLARPRRLPPLGDRDADRAADRAPDRAAMAVVIPARNEAHNIGAVVTAMLAQRRPDDEIVVVDDGSTDATASVAAAAGARVVTAGPLPADWAGKPHACHIGVAATTAPTIVFLDADIAPPGDLLDRLAARVRASPDALVSVQPWHRTERAYEQLSLPFGIVALMGTAAFTVFGHRTAGQVACGPVMACTRSGYAASGGHAHPDVRSAVVEDLALARRFPSVDVYTGAPGDVVYRMYPNGPRSLVEGWTKNMAAGAGRTPWWALVLIVAWIASISGGWAVSFWWWLATSLQFVVLGRRFGRWHPVTPFLHPLLAIGFVVLFVRSLVLALFRRPVTWKGRSLLVRR
jgi:4,4'-diaponeurosporenoate glycosyltransferase